MKKITSMMLIVAFVVSLLAACTVVRYDTKIEYVEQDGKLIIVKYNSGKTDLVVPEYVAGKPVVAVAERAFENVRFLKSVVFEGNSLERVGDYAFTNNGYLTKVVFPSSLQYIGKGAFTECDRLTTIETSGSAVAIEELAFYQCKDLQDIDLSNAQRIGRLAFGGCDGLAGELKTGATEIEDGAFIACDNLQSVDLTNVQNMGKAAFSDCGKLESVKLSERLTVLPESAYEGCRLLHSVESSALTQVGSYAFHQCSSLDRLSLAEGAQIYESSVKNSGLSGLEVIPEETDRVTIDGTVYYQTFEDEFSGSELDSSKWEHCPEWRRGGGVYWNNDDAFLDGNGNLVLQVSYGESPDGTEKNIHRTGAVRTRSKFDQTYGYYEIRCRFGDLGGVWSAFWLMPYEMLIDGTGNDGAEIDIYESPFYSTDAINYAIHWDGYGIEHQSLAQGVQIDGLYYGYHTYALKWTDTEYVFYVDGQEFWRVTDPKAISHEKLYMKVTAEGGAWAGNLPGAGILPAVVSETDYVRAYTE